jgi:hypothetical protein
MKSPKTLVIVVALLVLAFTAFAGSDAAVGKSKSDNDKTTVAPAQPARDAGKKDKAVQSESGSTETQKRKSEETQVRGNSSEGEQDYREPSPEGETVERREVRVPTAKSVPDEGEKGGQRGGGQGGSRGGSGGRGGGYGEHRHGGGWGWRGHHDEWRHSRYHGSWSFLWHFGPVIFAAPVHHPHIIRLPRHRVGVYVRQTGDDNVGERFARSVREHLREEGLRVVYDQDEAQLELYVVSMEQEPEDPGYGSSVSVSYVWFPGGKFITAQMLDVGVDEVDDLAQSVAAYADDLVDEYR